MIEVQLVNSVAPLYFASRSDEERQHRSKKHIINVSAMEGSFNIFSRKTIHTLIWQKPP
jgi:hypothetical protein